MANEEQNLILGVEYDGSQGVSQFLAALAPVPEQVNDLFSRMGSQLQGSSVWAKHGEQIARSMYQGLQGALAGFPQMAGSNFGSSVLASAGLTPAQVRQQRELVNQLNAMRDEFSRQGVPAATQRNFSQAEIMGLRQVEGAIERTARAYDDLAARRTRAQQQLDRMRNITTTPDGKLDPALQFTQGSAKAGVQWSEAATLISRTSGFQLPAVPTTATGMPSEAAARKVIQDELNRSISTMTRSISAMDQQMRVYNAAPAPKVEQVRQAVSTAVTGTPSAPTPLQQQIITARAEGASQRAVAADAGVTRYQVQKVDEVYAEEIATIRAAIAAREAEAAAIKAAANAHARETVPGNVSSSAQDRLGPQRGRSSFDFQPNEYLPYRDEFGNLVSNRESSAGSRYVTDRAGYERWWAQQPATSAELEMAYSQNAMRDRIKANAAQVRADTAAGLGLTQPSLTQTSYRLGGQPNDLQWQRIEKTLDRTQQQLTGTSIREGSSGSIPLTREELTAAFGGPVTWKDQLKAGFGSGPDNSKPFMEMVGQTARVALFYGAAYRALTLLQTALQQVTQETLAYEGSLTDLEIATGRNRQQNQALSTSLSSTATAAAFNPSQGIETGWKALGLYGVSQASQAEQERVAKLSTEVSTRVARVAGGDPVAIQTQLAGALRSFEYGINRLPQLEDMITYVSRNTGQAPTELLGATSNIATLGKSAGFTPEQLMAIVAQVGTTTGQNPEATAGQFRQVLSREFQAVAASAQSVFGVDTSNMSTVEQIFEAVSKVPRTQSQENQFTAAFGKGGSQSVALITLQNWDRIQSLATGATSHPGIGQDAFNRVMDNIGNKVKEFGSELMHLGVSLVETGVLDWLGLLVEAGIQLTREVAQVVDAFNMIPRPLRSVAMALGELYVASKLLEAAGVGGKVGAIGTALDGLFTKLGAGARIASRTTVTEGAVAAGQALRNAPSALGSLLSSRRLTVSAEDAAAMRALALDPTSGTLGQRLRMGAGGFTRLSGAGLGLVGIGVGAAALAGTAITNQMKADDTIGQVQASTAAAQTAEAMREAAAEARNAVRDLQDMSTPKVGDVMGLLPALIARATMGGDIKEAGRQAAFNDSRATALDSAQKAAEAVRPSAVFTDFSSDGLNTTLSDLEKRGYTATQRLQLLNEALFEFASNTSRANTGVKAVAALDQNQYGFFSAQAGSAALSAIEQARTGANVLSEGMKYSRRQSGIGAFSPVAYLPGSLVGQADERGLLQSQKTLTLSADDSKAVNDAVSTQIQLGLQKWAQDGVITPAEAESMVSSGSKAIEDALGPKRWAALDDATKKDLLTAYKHGISKLLGSFGGDVSAENVTAYLQVLPTLATGKGQDIVAAGGSETAGAQATLAALEQGKRDSLLAVRQAQRPLTTDDMAALAQVDTAIGQAKRALANAKIAEIRNILAYEQSSLKQDDVTGRLDLERQALQTQMSTLGDNLAAQRDALGGGQSYDVGNANRHGGQNAPGLDTTQWYQTQAQQNANAQSQATEDLAVAQNKASAGVYGGDSIGQAAVALGNARLALTNLTKDSSAWWAAQAQISQQQFALTQVQVQGINANALAKIDPRNTVGRLDQQIANARRERALYTAGDPQAGSLADQINQLQVQRAEAIISQANAAASAGIAGKSSGMLQAQVAVANAQRSLSGQLRGTEAYYSALGQLRQAQAQLAEQERSQADRVRRLNSDLTDPVAQARLDVQAAMAKAAADRAAGEGSDVQAQDQIDVKSAQNQAEAAAFNQRISDLQTAEDLGRISHTAYMSYLQSEHDRLTAVADRTRQQQEELDQVDKLMKAAAEQLNGQFNLGDIQLPTVYEVRRSIASGSPNQVADYSNSHNVVNVNGADFDQVVAWLVQYMGGNAQMVRSAPRRV